MRTECLVHRRMISTIGKIMNAQHSVGLLKVVPVQTEQFLVCWPNTLKGIQIPAVAYIMWLHGPHAQ